MPISSSSHGSLLRLERGAEIRGYDHPNEPVGALPLQPAQPLAAASVDLGRAYLATRRTPMIPHATAMPMKRGRRP